MNIEQLINRFDEELHGQNALIQVQINNKYFIRKIGDINKLAEKPRLVAISADSSFTEWMDEQISELSLKDGTIANHKKCLAHLTEYQPDIMFSDIDYSFVIGFERFLRIDKYSINTIAKLMKIFRLSK